ncbi:MAG: 5'/3'-nucleotidase SurE [Nannocystaceae bacterium]
MARPLILVSNDDGVLAPGIHALAEAVAPLGDVIVCAPDRERSGTGHAITLHSHLRAHPVREGWWSVSGTPVDCVYLGYLHLCPRRPDLVISGINPGYNLGSDVFYSGTVGAASEGFQRGSSAMAVSMHANDPLPPALPLIRKIAGKLLRAPERGLLNVNIPRLLAERGPGLDGPMAVHNEDKHDLSDEELAARVSAMEICVTRLGKRPYRDVVEERRDPRGNPYFWIGGPPQTANLREGEDTWAIAQGKVAVTPLVLDITAPNLDPWRQVLAPTGAI